MRWLVIICGVLLPFSGLMAQEAVKVVAVVNDQMVSSVDLDERLTFVMATTGIPDTEENRKRVTPQIVRQLIDEKLQMQEAAANGITISDDKVKESIAQIEKQSGKPPGSLESFLESRHASKAALYAQVRAQTAWAEIVAKKVRPKIRVSEQEIARYVKRKAASGPTDQEVMIVTLQLPVDTPQNDASVHKVADKLVEEIHSGASFEAVSEQFSGAGKVAEPFWVQVSQLDPVIAAAVAKLSKGNISDPVRTEAGYQIIKLMDSRQKQESAEENPSSAPPAPRYELAFRQIMVSPVPGRQSAASADALKAAAQNIRKSPGLCTQKNVPGSEGMQGVTVSVSFIRRLSANLPEKLRDILASLRAGNVSDLVVTPEGVRLFMLCERVELPPEKPSAQAHASSPSDDAARQAIFAEKMELEVQKYLRNMRREAFIEVRPF